MTDTDQRPTLVLGGTGKTGRRVVERLTRRDVPVRVGSRSAGVPFDWEQPATWEAAFTGAEAAYVAYAPDIGLPGSTEVIARLVEVARGAGTRRLVLLSGRGEDEARACEQIVMESSLEWTVLRSSVFSQNFSEGFLLGSTLAGAVMLPAGEVTEPFTDVDDIAEVAAAALTDDRHVGEVYELTGARALSFADAVATIADASGRDIMYQQIPTEDFAAGLAAERLPPELVDFLVYLFDTVLDGRNSGVGDGVERALGRPARDFSDFARATAATGVWNPEGQG